MTDAMVNQIELEKKARKRNLDPLMERSFRRLLGELPKRMLTMWMKLLSMKGVAFGAAFYLTLRGTIETWAFVLITLVLIFGEKALQFAKDIRG